jgi:hypothetical protein
MNYGSGNGKIFSTTSQESKFNPYTPLITFPTQAGTVSHPHMALEHNHEVLVPDLVRPFPDSLCCLSYSIGMLSGTGHDLALEEERDLGDIFHSRVYPSAQRKWSQAHCYLQ